MIQFEIPAVPPSINKAYYTDFNAGTRHKSKEYREFADFASYYIPKPTTALSGRLSVEYNFYFTDSRRRDIANYEKCLSDILVKCGVIKDDSLIDRIIIERGKPRNEPLTVIQIKEL